MQKKKLGLTKSALLTAGHGFVWPVGQISLFVQDSGHNIEGQILLQSTDTPAPIAKADYQFVWINGLGFISL